MVHIHQEVKAKRSVLPQEVTADSLSYTIDPVSISVLQVDQQTATASFLQEEQKNTSLCPLEIERGEDDRREVEKERLTYEEMARKILVDEDVEFRLSFLELPKAKTVCPLISDTMTATSHTEQIKCMCCATCDHCGIGMMKPPIPEVMLVSLQDQENNQKPQTTLAIDVLGFIPPASPLKTSKCGSTQTSVMQSISSSVQQPGNTSSSGSHNLMTYESNSQESTSNQKITPIINLSMLEDLDQGQWCVVQAHWEQLEETEALCRKEGTLLCKQPDMAFGEYVHKLVDIMERKARCVQIMIAQLQPYLKPSHSNQPHGREEDNYLNSLG
ncbi:hypothetical protein VZT92_019780 [Zoarces viviparus]|uniref:Uncharacterized protein n=1 Tax=Zoarces viviparus TaxID=48416 RepID=A0AAW1ELH0_ZOAVI